MLVPRWRRTPPTAGSRAAAAAQNKQGVRRWPRGCCLGEAAIALPPATGRPTTASGQERPPAFRLRPASRPRCGCSRVAPIADSRACATACRTCAIPIQRDGLVRRSLSFLRCRRRTRIWAIALVGHDHDRAQSGRAECRQGDRRRERRLDDESDRPEYPAGAPETGRSEASNARPMRSSVALKRGSPLVVSVRGSLCPRAATSGWNPRP
jgi:hypothetical protein